MSKDRAKIDLHEGHLLIHSLSLQQVSISSTFYARVFFADILSPKSLKAERFSF